MYVKAAVRRDRPPCALG